MAIGRKLARAGEMITLAVLLFFATFPTIVFCTNLWLLEVRNMCCAGESLGIATATGIGAVIAECLFFGTIVSLANLSEGASVVLLAAIGGVVLFVGSALIGLAVWRKNRGSNRN